MKKLTLIVIPLLCIGLSACSTQTQHHNTKAISESRQASSLKKANKKLKHKIKKEDSSVSSSSNGQEASNNRNKINNTATNQANRNNGQQQASHPQISNNEQPNNNPSKSINSAQDAVNAARAKYDDDNGNIHWHYMIDGNTGQPIRNQDGSYFVKGTANDGTMTGTQYSINVNPDGTMTSN